MILSADIFIRNLFLRICRACCLNDGGKRIAIPAMMIQFNKGRIRNSCGTVNSLSRRRKLPSGQTLTGAGLGQTHQLLDLQVLVQFRRVVWRQGRRLLAVNQFRDSALVVSDGWKSMTPCGVVPPARKSTNSSYARIMFPLPSHENLTRRCRSEAAPVSVRRKMIRT
jgi:hypothetical protein